VSRQIIDIKAVFFATVISGLLNQVPLEPDYATRRVGPQSLADDDDRSHQPVIQGIERESCSSERRVIARRIVKGLQGQVARPFAPELPTIDLTAPLMIPLV
jgi:hypothetical protein